MPIEILIDKKLLLDGRDSEHLAPFPPYKHEYVSLDVYKHEFVISI